MSTRVIICIKIKGAAAATAAAAEEKVGSESPSQRTQG